MKKFLLAATVAAGAMGLANSSQAAQGFYVTLFDGTTTVNQFFSSNTGGTVVYDGLTLNYSFGTNYPGIASFATLSTQITITGATSGSLTPFTSLTQVTDSAAISTPIAFSNPIGTTLEITASTSASTNPQLTGLNLIGSATGNATTVFDPAIGPNQASTNVVAFSALGGFTFSNLLDITSLSAASGGLSNEVIQTTAFVDFIPAPEPATLAILGAGLAALGLARRRHD